MPTWDISDTLPPFQKFRLIEVLIILDLVISHFQSQGHDLEPGILQIFFRQFTTAVCYDLKLILISISLIAAIQNITPKESFCEWGTE